MVRSEQEIEQLIRENQKLVQFQVNRYLQWYFVGAMEREDLISWGLIGLVQAARVWDPQRGSFATLACKVIELKNRARGAAGMDAGTGRRHALTRRAHGGPAR
jgi:DNA-directed RNA polymerase specialized sigma subunit